MFDCDGPPAPITYWATPVGHEPAAAVLVAVPVPRSLAWMPQIENCEVRPSSGIWPLS